MGIYNIIDIGKDCPNCGAKVEWQSKELVIDDIYRVVRSLDTFKINKRMDADIIAFCDECGAQAEADIKKGKVTNMKVKMENKR